ncbi:MAG: glycosyltransferase family 4 protein, partial [Candidatus Eremiobacteraeota bacterium]|nr:glycosyltransferase family 4 protein [Candidatus Eremiobacteraeota bacterium]
PITLAIPALFAAWQSRGALVADIRDVFPDVGVRMGRWSQGGVLTRTLGTLADRLYARSSLVVAVTNTARAAIVARRVPAAKVIVAMNGADRVSVAREAVFSRTDGAFVIAYVGNMGVATGLDALLDAARILPQNRFKFLLVGAGAQRDRLRTRVEREEIRNVDFLGVLPRENAARVLADANACIVPLAAGIRDSLPTKIFDALSVGCPVIVAAEGEARDFIVASGGGICVPPEDGHALASAIRRLAEDRALCERLSRSGREHLRSRYSRATIMNDLAARIVSGNLGHQTKAS